VPFPVPPHRSGRPHHRAPMHRLHFHKPHVRRAAPTPPRTRLFRHAVVVTVLAAGLLVVVARPAFGDSVAVASTLTGLISSLTDWLVGLLAAVATLFLTLGGVRYVTAGGDPAQIEKAKSALKSAAIGYALAALAPLIVSVLGSLVS
jgi:hypothetical protein